MQRTQSIHGHRTIRNYLFVLLCVLLLPLFSWAEESSSEVFCFFRPPDGWEISDPSTLSTHVKIAFKKPKTQGFCPSINLAVESTSVSLTDYLKAIKNIHEQDRNNQWRALGKVHTLAGPAQLTQIDTSSEWGSVRILQLILLKAGQAYVLTAAALKEEFPQLYREIQKTFRSLNLTQDLLQPVVQMEKKVLLKEQRQRLLDQAEFVVEGSKIESILKHPFWGSFEKEVATQVPEMGVYWQILVLKQAQEQLLSRLAAACIPETAPSPLNDSGDHVAPIN